MERLTFEGNFCDIALCAETPGGSFCESGACTQRKVWERLKAYEDAEEQGRLVVLPERPRVVAGRYECGRFYSELTGEEVASILNAYANGKLVPADVADINVGHKGGSMAECKHDFVYDELHSEIVCWKCGYVLAAEDKREALEHANALRRAEEADSE